MNELFKDRLTLKNKQVRTFPVFDIATSFINFPDAQLNGQSRDIINNIIKKGSEEVIEYISQPQNLFFEQLAVYISSLCFDIGLLSQLQPLDAQFGLGMAPFDKQGSRFCEEGRSSILRKQCLSSPLQLQSPETRRVFAALFDASGERSCSLAISFQNTSPCSMFRTIRETRRLKKNTSKINFINYNRKNSQTTKDTQLLDQEDSSDSSIDEDEDEEGNSSEDDQEQDTNVFYEEDESYFIQLQNKSLNLQDLTMDLDEILQFVSVLFKHQISPVSHALTQALCRWLFLPLTSQFWRIWRFSDIDALLIPIHNQPKNNSDQQQELNRVKPSPHQQGRQINGSIQTEIRAQNIQHQQLLHLQLMSTITKLFSDSRVYKTIN
ncbi:MAG: hypothetical protein EZS28_003868 [Streblomastix strix]|uniref:Uncharacterized protein n=1 Tax=Streblomastix strix TaxID=222440 RepID=A0A5J4X1S6_9EUKA|nr:MAG: hypothetical protein EZS28_003868 [Streblomastix strix]